MWDGPSSCLTSLLAETGPASCPLSPCPQPCPTHGGVPAPSHLVLGLTCPRTPPNLHACRVSPLSLSQPAPLPPGQLFSQVLFSHNPYPYTPGLYWGPSRGRCGGWEGGRYPGTRPLHLRGERARLPGAQGRGGGSCPRRGWAAASAWGGKDRCPPSPALLAWRGRNQTRSPPPLS